MESNDPHPTKILMAEIDAMLAERNEPTTATLWVTRDHTGVYLWKHRPRFCIGESMYFCGGEAMKLSSALFPQLPMNACMKVVVSIEEARA